MEQEQYLTLSSYQRAGLMAFVVQILQANDQITLREVQQAAINLLARFIDNEHMVGDAIDKVVINAAKELCEQEVAVEQVNDILNNLN